MSVFMDTSRQRTTKELLLFLTLLECTRQQTNVLDERFQGKAKEWVDSLKNTADCLMGEVEGQFNFSEAAMNTLGELYDYMYMNMRHASEMELENSGLFSEVTKTLFEYQTKARKRNVSLRQYLREHPLKF